MSITIKIIHTVVTGMPGSLPRCPTTFFTMVEIVEGVELLGTTTKVGVMVVEFGVVLVVLVTISTTCLASCHLLHHRRNVDGGMVCRNGGVHHRGDDGDGGIIIHPLVDGGKIVAHRHLLRVPLDLVLHSHH